MAYLVKLLRVLPDRHMVHIIMELVCNRSFTLPTGSGPRSRLRRLNNGIPQGSVLDPILFNIYTHDLPSTISAKYTYADDLAILHQATKWGTIEGTLSQDLTTLLAYLQNWRLKLSETKTVASAFHLHNLEAGRELKVRIGGNLLPFCPTSKYLGVTLNRSLTYRQHLVSLRKKLTSRATLLKRLAGSSWGAGADTLRTAALALVYSTAEYCAPVWCRSAHCHNIDTAINGALRTVTGCLRPTPTDNLTTLAGIQPAEFRREGATLSLARRALEPNHLLHSKVSAPLVEHPHRLKSRHPFVPAAGRLLHEANEHDISAASWANYEWSAKIANQSKKILHFHLRLWLPHYRNDSVKMGMGSP